jgi:hypothetical protein
MNAIVPAKDDIPQFGLVPRSMGEAMELARMMSTAKLVPAPLQKSPADCLMVIQQAVRWNMDAFAVAQECSVIQGKLMHSGKLVAAVVNSRGNLVDRLSYSYEGAGDQRTITVSGKLRGESEPRVVKVVLGKAKTQNKVWQTQPDQQLMYHGARVWARRHTPELMLGVFSPEEFDEPQTPSRRPPPAAPNVMLPANGGDETPKAEGEAAAQATQSPAGASDPSLSETPAFHDPETGEILEEPPAPVSEPEPTPEPTKGRLSRFQSTKDRLEQASTLGWNALHNAWEAIDWRKLNPKEKEELKELLENRWKQQAEDADLRHVENADATVDGAEA